LEHRLRQRLSFFLFLGFLFSGSAFALSVPDHPVGRVHDEAGLLTVDQRQNLESKLAAFEQETTNQIVVAIFPSLEGESLEDYSIRLAEKWKIGQKGKDNGIILLIFPNDRRLRIEVGYGLEAALPDAYASRIIEEKLKPNFRHGNFYTGIDQAVDALMAATRGIYELAPSSDSSSSSSIPLVFILFFFGIFGLIIFLAIKYGKGSGRRGWTYSGSSSSWSSSGSSWSSGGGGFSGGGGSFGGGGSSGSW
jgi:uncharacterized protein